MGTQGTSVSVRIREHATSELKGFREYRKKRILKWCGEASQASRENHTGSFS